MAWVDIPEDSDFSQHNLPLGVFSTPSTAPRVGIAVGEHILDCHALTRDGLVDGAYSLRGPTINEHLALGVDGWTAGREAIQSVISLTSELARSPEDAARRYLVRQGGEGVQMHLPFDVGDYTDFYLSREHATNVGTMFRGAQNALMDNWTCMPVAYHGRASTVSVAGGEVRRPWGQVGKPDSGEPPRLMPTRCLDFELELGYVYGGPGNALGAPVPLDDARARVFGCCLVNDWSARDVQPWEYRPLGPFTAKNFITTVSPWVVPLAALEPARCALPEPEPTAHAVLPYLALDDHARAKAAFDISLQVSIGRPAVEGKAGNPWEAVVSRSNTKWLYWSIDQMVAHHTVSGCRLRPGDLLATGTVSGQAETAYGSMLELTWRGSKPLDMPDGSTRCWVEDGDVVTIRGSATGRNGERVGFGECKGTVVPPLAQFPGCE
ncbi:hypothetical protein AB1Y20_000632 [Prymnesium parvum]|uniref:Fumarylacetoacetase n=1 Tax=Prymnesium parvum TaxID=97485 RepID=A0AB34K963_PRYPA